MLYYLLISFEIINVRMYIPCLKCRVLSHGASSGADYMVKHSGVRKSMSISVAGLENCYFCFTWNKYFQNLFYKTYQIPL
jgi:hypothetical protein